MEVWKNINRFSKYEFSNYGRVRNCKTLKICNIVYIGSGKLSVFINYKYLPVAPLIAEAFIDLSENQKIIDIKFKDNCFLNNNIENLIPIIKNI